MRTNYLHISGLHKLLKISQVSYYIAKGWRIWSYRSTGFTKSMLNSELSL